MRARWPVPRAHRGVAGVTLVELLVALAVFAIIVALAGAGVVQTLRMHRLNEAITGAQAKMRRTSEVVAQDVRSIALGSLVGAPYASGAHALAFTIQDGGTYSVLPHDSGQNASFVSAANVQIQASADSAAELGLEDREVLMANAVGQGIVLHIDRVTRRGGPGSNEWNLVHPGCGNTIDYTPNTTLLHVVRTVGYAFDADTSTLMRTVGGGEQQPVAFDVTRFDVTYVYVASDGSVETRSSPITDGDDRPLREPTIGGIGFMLDAVRIEIGTTEQVPSGEVDRSYVSQIELPDPVPASASVVEVCR